MNHILWKIVVCCLRNFLKKTVLEKIIFTNVLKWKQENIQVSVFKNAIFFDMGKREKSKQNKTKTTTTKPAAKKLRDFS